MLYCQIEVILIPFAEELFILLFTVGKLRSVSFDKVLLLDASFNPIEMSSSS